MSIGSFGYISLSMLRRPSRQESISPCFLVLLELQFHPKLFCYSVPHRQKAIFSPWVHRMARIRPCVLSQGERKTHTSKKEFPWEIPQLQQGILKATEAFYPDCILCWNCLPGQQLSSKGRLRNNNKCLIFFHWTSNKSVSLWTCFPYLSNRIFILSFFTI